MSNSSDTIARLLLRTKRAFRPSLLDEAVAAIEAAADLLTGPLHNLPPRYPSKDTSSI
jgi:hypothetical protein